MDPNVSARVAWIDNHRHADSDIPTIDFWGERPLASVYSPLGTNVLIHPEMIEAVGSQMPAILGNLGRGDCQTCGSSLVTGPVAVFVSVMSSVHASVSLHHPTCQPAAWYTGDSDDIHRTGKPLGAHTSYVTFGCILQPSLLPVILINPSIEAMLLHRDGNGAWLPATISTYRDAHNMQRGGDQVDLIPGHHGAGIRFTVLDEVVSLRMGVEGWDIEPGPAVVKAVEQSKGLLLAISSKYLGQDLELNDLKILLADHDNTALAWISHLPTPPPGVPAAEYLLYSNDQYSCTGAVIGRSKEVMASRDEARKWLVHAVCEVDDLPDDSFIDMTMQPGHDEAVWVINAVNTKLFVALPVERGWRAVRSYSRYGGPFQNMS